MRLGGWLLSHINLAGTGVPRMGDESAILILVLVMVVLVLAGLEGMDARWEDPRPDRWPDDAASRHSRFRRRGRFAAFLVATRRLRARPEASPADRAHGGPRRLQGAQGERQEVKAKLPRKI